MRELKRKTEENPRTRRTNRPFCRRFVRRDYNNFYLVVDKNNVEKTNEFKV